MESMCRKCGGLIGEPGKAYGWAGKWCHCAIEEPPAKIERLPTFVLGKPSPDPQPFLQWLRGYLDGGGSDMQRIVAELKKVLP